MPRISKRRDKELKQITSRLMQISLILDDYIYKQKTTISVSDAEEYIKEVASYKTVCGKQPRSLQVIEKITRCMKAIIFEQKEVNVNDDKTTNSLTDNTNTEQGDEITNKESSPVHSLPDEDMTQFSQDILADTDNYWNDNDQIKNANPPAKCTKGQNLPKHDHLVALEKAISIISRSDDDVDTTGSNYECSQSILSNFELPNISAINTAVAIDKITTLETINENIGTNLVKMLGNNTNITVKVKAPEQKNQTNDNLPNLQKTNASNEINIATAVLDKTIENYNRKNTANEVKIPVLMMTNNNLPIQKTNVSNETTIATAIPINSKTTNKQEKKQNGRKRKFKAPTKPSTDTSHNVTKRTKEKKEIHDLSNTKTNKDTTKKQIKQNINKNLTQRKVNDRNINISKDITKETITPKDTADTELSWIENLKYVRIVNDSEYDKNAKLDENFWDNLTLPSDWNEREFDDSF